MTATFSAEDILEITGGRLAQGMMPDESDAAELCIDTREMKEGSWFVALPGEQFDGHDFLGDAFSAGALGCIVSERGSYPIASSSFPLIAVDDTLTALKSLARNWRRRINPMVVAITGRADQPFGVVTQMMSRLLSSSYGEQLHFMPPNAVLPTSQSLKHLLAMDEDIRCCLFELAPRSMSELSLFCAALRPNVVIITEDGYENLCASSAGVDAIEALAEVLANMDTRKRLAISEDPPGAELREFMSYFPGRLEVFAESERQTAEKLGDVESRELAQHLWCVFTAAKELGLDEAAVLTRLKI